MQGSRFARFWESQTGKPLTIKDKILIGVLTVVFLCVFYIMLDANKYRAMVRVIEGEGAVGVNPTDRALDFGDLSRGTSAVRRVEIANKTFLPYYVMMFETGSIAGLMENDRNFFRVDPRETVKVNFTTYVPASAEIDRIYKGRVYVFKIPML